MKMIIERDEKARIAQEEREEKARIAQKEHEEKARIAQEEREEKARIAQKERDEQTNAQMMAIIGKIQDGKNTEQKPDQCRRMEPEPEQIRMTANAEDAASSINSEEVPAALTKKSGISDQPGMYLNDVAVCSIMAESVCNSIPLEKEIGSGTTEMLSYEEDEPRDMDMGVEGVLANVSSEDVICEATFQELSTTDTTIELDVVDVSSVNIVLEDTFGEEVFPEEINNNDGSRMEDLVGDSSLDTISEEWFGKEARPEEVCCGAPETQMVDMALGIEKSFGANGCRDMEDEFSLSVSPRNFPSKEDRDLPPKQNLIGRRTEQDVSSDSGKERKNSPENSEKNLGEKEDPRINRSDHEIMAPRRDKTVRPKKVKARVSPTDLQLSLKEGRGLDRRLGKGDLANKGCGRGRSKDREVRLSILGKEIVEANRCQGTEPENQKRMTKEQESCKGVLIKELLATVPIILQQQKTLNVHHLRANQKGMTYGPFDRGKIRESCQHIEPDEIEELRNKEERTVPSMDNKELQTEEKDVLKEIQEPATIPTTTFEENHGFQTVPEETQEVVLNPEEYLQEETAPMKRPKRLRNPPKRLVIDTSKKNYDFI